MKIGVLGVLLLIVNNLYAQTDYSQRYGGNASSSSQSRSDSMSANESGYPDTAHITHYFAENPHQLFAENDSLLNRNFQHYDPTRRRMFDYRHISTVGTAAYPFVYAPQQRFGLDLGLHAFDVYTLKNSEIKFYQQTKAFSDMSYSGSSQDDGVMNARFSRNFAKNINFSVELRRIFNLGLLSNEVPSVQGRPISDLTRCRTTALGVGLSWHRRRSNGFLTYTNNSVQQYERGGIVDMTIFDTASEGGLTPTSPEQFLDNGLTKTQKNEVSLLQNLYLNRDSTGLKRRYIVTHQISYRAVNHRFSDIFGSVGSPSVRRYDTLFYTNFLNDERGMRFVMKENFVENAFSIKTAKLRTDSLQKKVNENDLLEVGIVHQYQNVNQEVTDFNFNNILLRGRFNFSPNRVLDIRTYAHFNILGKNLGDYKLQGDLQLNLQKLGKFNAQITNQLYDPTLLQQNFYANFGEIWKTDFKKTLETQISASISIPRLGFELIGRYSLLNNYVYFDTLAKPTQISTPLSIPQFILNQNFKFGILGSENTLVWQRPTEKVVFVPEFFMKNSLFIEGKIFKKVMLTRFGFDVRYNSAFYAPAYMPFSGQFYQQNSFKTGKIPAVDAYLSFKVQTLRLFFKMENVIGDLAQGQPVWNAYRMPLGERTFRFGLRWLLLN